MIEPIKRYEDAIDILDQRALPETLAYLHCTRGDQVIDAIKTLAVRGAPAIGIAGLYGLWLEAQALRDRSDFPDELVRAKDRIKAARPTAVNLAWAIDRTWAAVPKHDPDHLVGALREAADALYEEERDRNDRMARYGATLLTSESRILTHCNTGSLATVGVGTALGVIREAHRQGLVENVFVDETRPLLQGARLTAWELLQDGIPATLITDSMAAAVMAEGRIDAIMVGADRICKNGDTANKIGTYGLAVLAQYHRIPFYVVAPLSTVDPTLDSGAAIPIEQRSPDEVRSVRGTPIAPTDIGVHNPAFDVTPGHLITAIITDQGIARVPYPKSIPELLQATSLHTKGQG